MRTALKQEALLVFLALTKQKIKSLLRSSHSEMNAPTIYFLFRLSNQQKYGDSQEEIFYW